MLEYCPVDNCACPKCGHTGSFWITTNCMTLYELGKTEPSDTKEWDIDDYPFYECPECEYYAHESHFMVKNHKMTKPHVCKHCGTSQAFGVAVTTEMGKNTVTLICKVCGKGTPVIKEGEVSDAL